MVFQMQSSRYEQLSYLSHAIEKEQGRTLAFRSLDKKDRIAFLALCKISRSTVNWDKIGKIRLKNAVQQLIQGGKERLPNLLPTLPKEMTKAHLTPFLSGKDLANLKCASKANSELDSASHIIKTHGLALLIARYGRCPCITSTEAEKIQGLSQLMSLAKDLSKLEHLEEPNYQSVGKFFEFIEARNLLRMARGIHRGNPLADLENEQLRFAEDSVTTLQNAEKIREWFGQHQADLIAFNDLNLEQVGLTLLPPEIRLCRNLRSLHLENNFLASIPREIGELRFLETLRLENNCLTNLPREIEQLQHKLLQLKLRHNRLTRMPNEIYQLKKIVYLDLSHNQLTAISKKIKQLRRLSELDLSNNRLANLPREIGRLKALNYLFVRHNHLTQIPKEILQLGNYRLADGHLGARRLTKVNFDHNRIAELPNEFYHLFSRLHKQRTLSQLLSSIDGLDRCINKQRWNSVANLLNEMEKIHGKKICAKLHACIYEVCKKEKALRQKLKNPHFGKTAFTDPKIDPKLKMAALDRFKVLVKVLPEYQSVPIAPANEKADPILSRMKDRLEDAGEVISKVLMQRVRIDLGIIQRLAQFIRGRLGNVGF